MYLTRCVQKNTHSALVSIFEHHVYLTFGVFTGGMKISIGHLLRALCTSFSLLIYPVYILRTRYHVKCALYSKFPSCFGGHTSSNVLVSWCLIFPLQVPRTCSACNFATLDGRVKLSLFLLSPFIL